MEENEWKDKYIRLLSDFENYKRNKNKELNDAENSGKKDMASKLIPFLDDLDNLFKYNKSNSNIMALYNNYLNTLTDIGINAFCEVGDIFNEECHHAIGTSNSGNVPHNSISAVIKKGYILNEEIIRYPNVIVEL